MSEVRSGKHRIVVVGGGTAGAIAASYVKQCWGDEVEVVLIYDHSKPNIGIGESLTPQIYTYLRYVGISREELIQNVKATVKLGIKFKNWLGDGSEYYHAFGEDNAVSVISKYNLEAAWDIANGTYDQDCCYQKDFFDHCKIPLNTNANQSVHIDGQLFSKFVIEKFADRLTIYDDKVKAVVKKSNSQEIDYIVLEKHGKLQGDFFIDSSGFAKVLFSQLDNEWIDKSDWCPIDSCIPNPVFLQHETLPVCTTAEASQDGWILNVPLQHRWGTGYLFSSKFTSNQTAIDRFSQWVKNKFGQELTNDRVMNFTSGYWKKQWVGNCISIGLSSGFSEPLEATNIHQAVYQMRKFCRSYNFKNFAYDAAEYNRAMQQFYDRIYLFIRFCYSTGRQDSDFWKYITANTPEEITMIEEKISEDFLDDFSMEPDIFDYTNFTKIAYGLKKINTERYKLLLQQRGAYEAAGFGAAEIKRIKQEVFSSAIDHTQYIKSVLNNTMYDTTKTFVSNKLKKSYIEYTA